MLESIHILFTEKSGISRCNLTNESWHDVNDKAAMQLFGFPTCKETKLCVSGFFTEVKQEKPKLLIENGEATIKPTYLTDF